MRQMSAVVIQYCNNTIMFIYMHTGDMEVETSSRGDHDEDTEGGE